MAISRSSLLYVFRHSHYINCSPLTQSQSPSEAPGGSAALPPNRFLSPNYQHIQPLPPARPPSRGGEPPLVPTVPNTPVQPVTPLVWPSQNPASQAPPPIGFVPQSITIPLEAPQLQPSVTFKGRPISAPVPFPSVTNNADPALILPSITPSNHEIHGPRSTSGAGIGLPTRMAPPLPVRAPSPNPFMTRTAPSFHSRTPSLAAAQPLPPSRPTSVLSSVSHSRHKSLNATPGPAQHTLPRVASNVSMRSNRSNGSYAKYDPSKYLDPAFYDVTTQVNTIANGGSSIRGAGTVHPRSRANSLNTNGSRGHRAATRSRAGSSSSLEYFDE